MGKTRDLFEEIRHTKGTFHATMGTVEDRNGMDLTEAEDIKKRWQEYTELYKEDLHGTDNQDGVTTQLESDILDCEVYWALGHMTMNKASGGDGIPTGLFQIQMLSCRNHKLKSRFPVEISTADMQMTPLLWQKPKRN